MAPNERQLRSHELTYISCCRLKSHYSFCSAMADRPCKYLRVSGRRKLSWYLKKVVWMPLLWWTYKKGRLCWINFKIWTIVTKPQRALLDLLVGIVQYVYSIWRVILWDISSNKCSSQQHSGIPLLGQRSFCLKVTSSLLVLLDLTVKRCVPSCVSMCSFQLSFCPQCCLAFLSCHSSNQLIRYLQATKATIVAWCHTG